VVGVAFLCAFSKSISIHSVVCKARQSSFPDLQSRPKVNENMTDKDNEQKKKRKPAPPCCGPMVMTKPRRRFLFYTLFIYVLIHGFTASAWEWSNWIVGGSRGRQQSSSSASKRRTTASTTSPTSSTPAAQESAATFLTLAEVSEMRVRDLKWRLARHHGYSAEELGQMIDKKDLIQALAYAEEQSRLGDETEAKRSVIIQGLWFSFVAMVTVCLWPLIAQAWEVALVNMLVYKDRKVHEAQRCLELKSPAAVLGVVLMGILDILQGM
jgi:hypothetical protein